MAGGVRSCSDGVGIERLAKSLLAAPGKIALSKNRVAIGDASHHRNLRIDHLGKIPTVDGGRDAGRRDGSIERARFSLPRDPVSSLRVLIADPNYNRILP